MSNLLVNYATEGWKSGIILHQGAKPVQRGELLDVETPEPTKSWTPISHHLLAGEVQRALEYSGYDVVDEVHGLTRDGGNYFGIFRVERPGDDGGDYSLLAGVRNSHLRQYAASVAAGSSVTVCDNLSFCGDVTLSRKHTRHILADLEAFVHRAVTRLSCLFNDQDNQFRKYQGHELSNERARSLMIECLKRRVITAQSLPAIVKEWEEPSHEEFSPRTLWSLFNAVTEAGKVWGPHMLQKRTQLLHGLCNAEIGIAV